MINKYMRVILADISSINYVPTIDPDGIELFMQNFRDWQRNGGR